MAAIIDYYNYIFYELADKRAENFFLCGSPFPIVGLLIAYYYFVTYYGPKWMKNRSPFNVDQLMVLYNAVQIIMNAYIFGLAVYFASRIDIRCQPVRYTYSEFDMFQLNSTWLYFMNKVLDLADTIFFVVRKKQNQVTFLHVYHHILMVLTTWLGTRYVGGGHCIYFGLLNSAVHTVMYFYYLLTSYSEEYKKNLWWKKYLTQMQMVQFVLILCIYTPLLFNDCDFPKIFIVLFLTQAVYMLYLFSRFYYRAYIKPKKN